MDVLLRRLRAVPWRRAQALLVSDSAQRFAAGCVLGILAACTQTQWRTMWGSTGPFDHGMALAVVLSLVAGSLCQRRANAKWPLWLMLASSASVVCPAWMESVGRLPGIISTDSQSSTAFIELVAAAIALLSLGPVMFCWSGLISAWSQSDTGMQPVQMPLGGIATGVLLAALVGGPAWGLEITAILGATCGMVIGLRATWNSRRISPETQSRSEDTVFKVAGTGDHAIDLGIWFCCGGLIAVGQHLIRHLIPQTAPLELSTVAVVVIAAAGGLGLATRRQLHRKAVACVLIGLAVYGLLSGQLFEIGLHARLLAAAYLTNANLHQLSQIAMVLAACGPAAFVAGFVFGAQRSMAATTCVMTVFLGTAVGGELLLLLSDRLLIGGIACVLAALAAAMHWRSGGTFATRRQSLGWSVVAAGLVVLTWMQPEIDPARPAKLLFSTQTFLGYRAGWSIDQLPFLDDSRLIAQVEGRVGTSTLWKSRGHDLLLREAGIPRCAISTRTDISPQPSAEVLQTVFPLLVAAETRDVLLLGASGGVPLSVFLEFPVERIDCVEPDAARMELIRRPIAAERGFDPFADERVRHDARPIELAVRTPGGGYDIILSSAPLSSLSAGAPQFTEEFYGQVSRKLSAHGLFCQRWEGIDYGPAPLQLVISGLAKSFANVAAVEIGVGDFLFLATNSEAGLVPHQLPERLETPHVRRLLARSGWDWSTLLTLPAWDRASLAEFAADGMASRNTSANSRLAFVGPKDVLRWGPKLQETQELLTKNRTSSIDEPPTSRRSRYLDWLGDSIVSQDVLRRLSEVAAQAKLVAEGPDTCWLDYRKVLREELQQRPRTEIRQVSATDQTQRVLHPEDERRKQYFVDLGQAGNLKQRNLEKVYDLEQYFEPYDPLVSLFARQETAELLKFYGHPDLAAELSLRLHVIHFAPTGDRSLLNVLAAAELLLEHSNSLADPQQRFDALNGLLQTLRTRWELRSASQVKSVRLAIHDVDHTLVVIEQALAELDALAVDADVDANSWPARRNVLERMLVRPLRGYRAELTPLHERNKLTTEATLLEAKLKRKK